MANRDIAELRWLAQQGAPMWGGVLARGGGDVDPQIRRWLEDGLIKPVEQRGYVITNKGRQFCGQREQTCPHCGRPY